MTITRSRDFSVTGEYKQSCPVEHKECFDVLRDFIAAHTREVPESEIEKEAKRLAYKYDRDPDHAPQWWQQMAQGIRRGIELGRIVEDENALS